jgi:hypothetical protein
MPNTFDFLTNDIIVYCYKNQIGLYSLASSYVYRNIHFNKEINPNRANCIKTFLREKGHNKYFIVCGYDSGDLVIYSSADL